MRNIINSIQSKKHNLLLISPNSSRNKWLIISFWIAGVAMGAWQAWEGRHHMSADGMSYLEVADAYLREDWKTAVNGYWSPLYSWLIGIAILVLKPSPYYEFTVVHIVNFIIYLCTIGCFHFLLLQLVDYHRPRLGEISENYSVTFSEWAWIALGYCLFFYTSLAMIGVWDEGADMLVAAFVYLASGIIIRMRRGTTSYLSYALLGVTLGFAYLAKAVMFPLGFIFLSLSVFSMGNLRKALSRAIFALIVFLMVASPFIIALSNSKGRLTFGDSGNYSYWFHVNGYSNYHWAGDPPGSGIPKHPMRKIHDKPVIYEFETPLNATYPLWYDPSYWNDGVKVHFDLNKQLKTIKKGIKFYFNIFYSDNNALFFGSLILYVMSRRRWLDILKHWSLFIPAIAALSMYTLVSVDYRYSAPFVTLIWLGILSSIHLPDSEESKRLLRNVTLVVVLVMTIVTTRDVITHNKMLNVQSPSSHVQWQIADALNNMGVLPGDKVASIGFSHGHFWARVARVRIVAEISRKNADVFWMADKSVQSSAIKALSSTGAKVIVTTLAPENIDDSGWQKLPHADYIKDYYVYKLSK